MAGGSGGRGRGEDYDDKRGVAQVGTFEVLLVQCDGEASTNQDRFSRSPQRKNVGQIVGSRIVYLVGLFFCLS